ncbi:hypothetical protein D3C72_111230 [compost metagenome]
MMRRWKSIGKAMAGLCVAMSVSACAAGFPLSLDFGRIPTGSSLTNGGKNPSDGEGTGDSTERPPFVALYPTTLGPMLYKAGKLYSLTTDTPQEWGKAPREGMAWSVFMLSSQEGWSVGAEGISRYKNQLWEPVVNSSHELLAPASNQGVAVQLSDVAFADSTTGYAVGTYGTVLRYANGTWSRMSDAKLAGKHFGSVKLDGTDVWVAGEDLLRFSGNAWESIGLPEAGVAVNSLLVLSDAVWASTGDGLWRYDRMAKVWDAKATLEGNFLGGLQAVSGNQGTRAMAMEIGVSRGRLFQLGISGEWTQVTTQAPIEVGLDALVMQDFDTGYALSYDGASLYKFDQGTWSRLSF